MSRGRSKSILNAVQARCNYLLNGNIAQQPCAMQHLDNIDFENVKTGDEKIKDAMKSLAGFGIAAEQAFKNFIDK